MTDLVDRLAAHRTLGGVPRRELEWLAAHGELRAFGVGDIAVRRDEPIDKMFIQLCGRVSMVVDRGTGRRHQLETRGGDVSALLPFSRMTTALADARVEEPTEALAIHRDQFPEMLRECPAVIETLVHVMVDRTRQTSSTTWQDEKMVSLGRLAAGLAHELNNPASAAVRSAKLMSEALSELSAAAQAVGAAPLSEAQRIGIVAISRQSFIPPTTGVFSAIERSDREDEIAAWLEHHGANPGVAAQLAESGVTPEALEDLAEFVSREMLDVALRWIAAEFTVKSLALDVGRATSRIHDLVAAVKRFTYVDRAAGATPTNIAQGLADTVAVLATKAKAKSIAVRLEVSSDLPSIMASADELNQVWSNLLENALDAAGQAGEVTVCAAREDDSVVVRVVDDGPGIPPDVQAQMFDPFFTTKPLGQGTGLGLDIARRAVLEHAGQIAVETRPGRTEFRVILPLDRAQRASLAETRSA